MTLSRLSKPIKRVHDSVFTGEMWIDELVEGHPRRMRESMGMASHVFQNLVKEMRKAGLRDSC
ncbi:hypothetical protein F5050DRAFT_1579347 [Lentinula boryana]|uniref:DUF8040 domain-containing protein n=1 Tax=Lentinula boryana TaxID=40481 RepID=A0ABQ8Q2C8_9AGAR|nr:hypothetical protein F5050DRAFT_1579347 [Lentinula boryana]